MNPCLTPDVVKKLSESVPAIRILHCVSEKTSPFLYLLQLNQMSSNFANSWQKCAPGNLEQTQMHSQPHLVSRVCTVQCEI